MTKQRNQDSQWLPLGERVLLKPATPKKKEENKLASGIILPDSVASEEEKKSPLATVVAVSPDLLRKWQEHEAPIEAGDTVLISSMGNDRIKVNGEAFIIAPMENVLAKKV